MQILSKQFCSFNAIQIDRLRRLIKLSSQLINSAIVIYRWLCANESIPAFYMLSAKRHIASINACSYRLTLLIYVRVIPTNE